MLNKIFFLEKHPPEDDYTKKYKQKAESQDKLFDKIVDIFQGMGKSLTYYDKQTADEPNNNATASTCQCSNGIETMELDGYEEMTIAMFRKIPEEKKREAFKVIRETLKPFFQ